MDEARARTHAFDKRLSNNGRSTETDREQVSAFSVDHRGGEMDQRYRRAAWTWEAVARTPIMNDGWDVVAGSRTELAANADGSVTIHFAPSKPAGVAESNGGSNQYPGRLVSICSMI